MSQFHSLFDRAHLINEQSGEDSTVRTAEAISNSVFGRELTPQQKQIAGLAVHYTFGGSMAAIYGVAVELWPPLRNGWGLPFGAVVWLGAHVTTVPALGLSAPITQSPPENEAVEFGAHLVYGAVVETLRRALRNLPRA
jgi:uncharacterized membrane protein YagU involved in acid resistance